MKVQTGLQAVMYVSCSCIKAWQFGTASENLVWLSALLSELQGQTCKEGLLAEGLFS